MENNQNDVINNSTEIKEQNNNVSKWIFMLLQLLYWIPGIGVIAACIMIGVTNNINLKNHAISSIISNIITFIFLIIAIPIFVIIYIIYGLSAEC